MNFIEWSNNWQENAQMNLDDAYNDYAKDAWNAAMNESIKIIKEMYFISNVTYGDVFNFVLEQLLDRMKSLIVY